jgi:hypothetical protein
MPIYATLERSVEGESAVLVARRVVSRFPITPAHNVGQSSKVRATGSWGGAAIAR